MTTREWHVRFKAHGKPLPQPRPRGRIIWPKRAAKMLGAYLFGHTYVQIYTPADANVNAFRRAVARAAREVHPGPPLKGPLRCDLLFVFPRPKTRTRKTLPNPRYLHEISPDEDNVRKAVYDALKGIVWIDDKQVCQGWFDAVVASGDEGPHVAVDISAAKLTWDGLNSEATLHDSEE